jgi:hypothetical protein
VIGNLAVQTEPAEPAICQIEMNLLAEPPLGPDANAVADDQHSDHQLRVNRGPSNLTVKGLQSLMETLEVEMPINAALYMIGRNVVVEAEIVKQLSRCRLNAHHRRLSRIRQDSESRPSLHINRALTFSTISAHSGRPRLEIIRKLGARHCRADPPQLLRTFCCAPVRS